MPRFVLALLLGLVNPVQAQDAVQAVLQAAPQLVSFAGSAENFHSLVLGLTEGTPVRLAAPAAEGFSRITFLKAPVILRAAEAAALLERARQDLAILGIAQPSPEQLSAVLAGGILDTPTGRTELRGVLAQPGARTEVRTQLEPDPRRPSLDERAFAELPVEIQSLLRGLPRREALLKVDLAQQHLIALGIAYPSPDRLRAVLQDVLAPQSGHSVASVSAGATSFPPLSPLVAPFLPAMR